MILPICQLLCDPGANRTRNLQLRRLLLYPVELRGRCIILDSQIDNLQYINEQKICKELKNEPATEISYYIISDF